MMMAAGDLWAVLNVGLCGAPMGLETRGGRATAQQQQQSFFSAYGCALKSLYGKLNRTYTAGGNNLKWYD